MIKLNFYNYEGKDTLFNQSFFVQLQISNITIAQLCVDDRTVGFNFLDCSMIERNDDFKKIEEYEISFNKEFKEKLEKFNFFLKKTITQFIVGRFGEIESRDPFLDNNLKIIISQELDKLLES